MTGGNRLSIELAFLRDQFHALFEDDLLVLRP
jgi:hypothetical protein